MVLNPALARDPASGRLHMLFRATGPGRPYASADDPLPYPIALGYAWSDDGGKVWTPDFSRPALSPRLALEPDELWLEGPRGEPILDYANGCIEDPRLIWVEGRLYLTVAARFFPPGPYWEHDDPMQCAPAWATAHDAPFGRAVAENLTVNVLYEVHLQPLAAGDYEQAFTCLGPLTDPQRGDNRDAFLFPERLLIDGRSQYVCVHRPRESEHYPEGEAGLPPAIYLSAADELEALAGPAAQHVLLARGTLAWEGNRIGGSFPPIRIDPKRWLLPYHGKQNDTVGYTQSFMILEQDATGWPRLKHRCGDRILYATEPWHFPGRFNIPCLFTCGGVLTQDGDLLMSYGAGDEVAGLASVDFNELVTHVATFDESGLRPK